MTLEGSACKMLNCEGSSKRRTVTAICSAVAVFPTPRAPSMDIASEVVLSSSSSWSTILGM